MQFPDLEPLYREALATPLLSARDALEVVLDSMLERGAYKHTPTVNAHARMRAVAFQFAARELGLRPLGYNRPGTERQPRAFQHLWVCFERIGALDLVAHLVDELDRANTYVIIADEAHRLKNADAAVTKRVLRYMEANEKPRRRRLDGAGFHRGQPRSGITFT